MTSDGRRFCTRWTPVEGGKHVLSGESPNGIADETVFTSLVYGVGTRIAYLYNPGFNLEKMTCTISASGTPTGQGEVLCDTLRPSMFLTLLIFASMILKLNQNLYCCINVANCRYVNRESCIDLMHFLQYGYLKITQQTEA